MASHGYRALFSITVFPLVLLFGSTAITVGQSGPIHGSVPNRWARVQFEERIVNAIRADGSSIPLSESVVESERVDLDGDGELDLVVYYDFDNDDEPDAESIDLTRPGSPRLVVVRCDVNSDGLFADWLIVERTTGAILSALVDSDRDGRVDVVERVDGTQTPLSDDSMNLYTSLYHR